MKTNYVQLEHLVVVGHRWLVFPFARGVGGLVVGLWGGGGGVGWEVPPGEGVPQPRLQKSTGNLKGSKKLGSRTEGEGV